MSSFSIVIVCKNEGAIIASTLQSLQGLTDDVIVFDSGSTDNTIEIAKQFEVRIQQGRWEGFGKTKNKAASLAKYDWILSLDADESLDAELRQTLFTIELKKEMQVYKLRFKNFFGNKHLKFGEWGSDGHLRIFNRKVVMWNVAAVHEKLILPPKASTKKLKGFVLHQTARNIKEYDLKVTEYAMLSAEKFYLQGKKTSWLKIHIAPSFNFVYNYILKLGFLDGRAGYICAKMTAHYTFLKYAKLKELCKR